MTFSQRRRAKYALIMATHQIWGPLATGNTLQCFWLLSVFIPPDQSNFWTPYWFIIFIKSLLYLRCVWILAKKMYFLFSCSYKQRKPNFIFKQFCVLRVLFLGHVGVKLRKHWRCRLLVLSNRLFLFNKKTSKPWLCAGAGAEVCRVASPCHMSATDSIQDCYEDSICKLAFD